MAETEEFLLRGRMVWNAFPNATKMGDYPLIEIASLTLGIVRQFDNFRTQNFERRGKCLSISPGGFGWQN